MEQDIYFEQELGQGDANSIKQKEKEFYHLQEQLDENEGCSEGEEVEKSEFERQLQKKRKRFSKSQKFWDDRLLKQCEKRLSIRRNSLDKRSLIINKQNRVLAFLLLRDGEVDLTSLNNELKTISPSLVIVKSGSFNNVMSRFTTDLIRSMELYLVNECKIAIRLLRVHQFGPFLSLLAKCKKSLDHQTCSTVLQFIKYVYQLGTANIDPNALKSLHDKIKQLSAVVNQGKKCGNDTFFYIQLETNKIMRFRKFFPFKKFWIDDEIREQKIFENFQQMNALWNQQHQKLLIKTWKEMRTIAEIKTKFLIEFPQLGEYWTEQFLHNRVLFTLRKSVLTLQQMKKSQNMPCLPRLKSFFRGRWKILCNQFSGLQVRMWLFDLIEGLLGLREIKQLIKMINNFFIAEEQKQKKLKQYLAEQKQKLMRQKQSVIAMMN